MAAAGFVFGAQSEKVSRTRSDDGALVGHRAATGRRRVIVEGFSPERVVFGASARVGQVWLCLRRPTSWRLVQLPRLALMVLAFGVPFYAQARPTPSLSYYFLVFYLLAYAVSGYAYVASMLCSLKDAQLLIVVTVLVLTMLAPPAETLYAADKSSATRVLAW